MLGPAQMSHMHGAYGMQGWLGKARLAEALGKTQDAEQLYSRAVELSGRLLFH